MPVCRHGAAASRRARAIALALGIEGLVALPAAAQEATVPRQPPAITVAPPAQPRVDIVVAPSDDLLVEVRGAVGQRAFASASVRWSAAPVIDTRDIMRPVSAKGDAALRVWIDLSHPRTTRLYFANAAGARFLVRDLALSPTFDAVDREAVGEVLELAVSALLEDDRAGMNRQQMESLLGAAPQPPRPPPRDAVAAPAPSWRPVVDVAVTYTAQAFSVPLPIAHGPGLAVAAGTNRGSLALSLWTTGQYQVPESFEQNGVGVELSTIALRAGVEGGLQLAARRPGRAFSGTFAGLRLGAGADFVHVRPFADSGDPTLTVNAPHWSTSPVLLVAVRFTTSIGDDVEIVAEPLVDVVLTREHYDVSSGGARSVILPPFGVRPGAMLGVGWR
jgi:hypothetical protein